MNFSLFEDVLLLISAMLPLKTSQTHQRPSQDAQGWRLG